LSSFHLSRNCTITNYTSGQKFHVKKLEQVALHVRLGSIMFVLLLKNKTKQKQDIEPYWKIYRSFFLVTTDMITPKLCMTLDGAWIFFYVDQKCKMDAVSLSGKILMTSSLIHAKSH
jgi:hypothetical protein